MTDRGLNQGSTEKKEEKASIGCPISEGQKARNRGEWLRELGRVGYCMTGSFCTLERSFRVMKRLVEGGCEVYPIMSENVYYTDTRFASCEEFSRRVEDLTKKKIIRTVTEAEALGPTLPLDLLIVSPCTGNTLAKVANGITDTAATMAIKAHLRCDRPLLIGLATNDAMSANLGNIGKMLMRKSVYFLPMLQDSPEGKPHSLVAEFERTEEAIQALVERKQLRPLFLA